MAVEHALGDKDIICLNDLAHEIFSVGANFESAIGILSPFQLSTPEGHFEKKVLHIHHEVESKAGFLGAKMDEFVNELI